MILAVYLSFAPAVCVEYYLLPQVFSKLCLNCMYLVHSSEKNNNEKNNFKAPLN